MWCDFFSETSIVAFEGEGLETPIGFVSGFIHPDKPDTLFIWQMAVHVSEREQGLATNMLHGLLGRNCCDKIQYIEATVAASNTPSNNLFISVARSFHSNYKISRYFEPDDFPESDTETQEVEWLYRIGPFKE